ncbi:MAG: hypothetical protein AB4042_04985, partial [Leptolyngbyaceae cyanobacterium]
MVVSDSSLWNWVQAFGIRAIEELEQLVNADTETIEIDLNPQWTISALTAASTGCGPFGHAC